LLEWFIVAFISMPNDRIEIKLMQESFDNKASCVKYMRETPGIVNDIMIIEPSNTGMYFQCLDTESVARYKVKRKSI
jgi:hypothetical protein